MGTPAPNLIEEPGASEFMSGIHGFYPHLTDKTYFSRTLVTHRTASNSALKPVGRSVPHFAASLESEGAKTMSLSFGNAYHYCMLQPNEFESKVLVVPPCVAILASGNRKGEQCGAPASALQGSNGFCGKHSKGLIGPVDEIPEDIILLSEPEFDDVRFMRDALWMHPVASLLMEGDIHEGAFLANDPETGMDFKGKVDHFSSLFDDTLVDLKSAEDASPEGFARALYDWSYFTQAPMYVDGMNLVGRPAKNFTFIAQEKKKPYLIGVYLVDHETMEYGRREYRRRMRMVADFFGDIGSRDELVASGYGDTVMPIGLASWRRAELDRLYEAEQAYRSLRGHITGREMGLTTTHLR